MSIVRVLIVGVGGMGQEHVQQLAAMDDVSIVGLVDPSSAAIAAARNRFPALASVPSFDDCGEAFGAVQADAAVIVSPHSYHLEHGLACMY